MKYNGIELEPITTPQIFDPPKEMLVWDDECDTPHIVKVWAIAPAGAKKDFGIYCVGMIHYKHCAEIPDAPKPKRATYIQLIEWLAKGNGVYRFSENAGVIRMDIFVADGSENTVLDTDMQIRPFGTTEWLEPTLENMGMEDK